MYQARVNRLFKAKAQKDPNETIEEEQTGQPGNLQLRRRMISVFGPLKTEMTISKDPESGDKRWTYDLSIESEDEDNSDPALAAPVAVENPASSPAGRVATVPAPAAAPVAAQVSAQVTSRPFYGINSLEVPVPTAEAGNLVPPTAVHHNWPNTMIQPIPTAPWLAQYLRSQDESMQQDDHSSSSAGVYHVSLPWNMLRITHRSCALIDSTVVYSENDHSHGPAASTSRL